MGWKAVAGAASHRSLHSRPHARQQGLFAHAACRKIERMTHGDPRSCHNTLAHPVILEGAGLHSGRPARVTVRPSAGGGRVFWCGGTAIPALAEYVVDTRRCTTLGRDGARVQTVEHLLAALWLAEIDSCEIVIEGTELPALDGAAAAWMQAITAAGGAPLSGAAPVWTVTEPAWITNGDSEFFLCPAPAPALYAAIDVPGTVATAMMAGGPLAEAAVRDQIVRARTYALDAEVRALLAAGLGQGGSLDNCVVLTADGYRNAQVWPHEPAWHKVLDLAGDLALCGMRLHGQVLAVRGGHRSHVALAGRVRAACQTAQNTIP